MAWASGRVNGRDNVVTAALTAAGSCAQTVNYMKLRGLAFLPRGSAWVRGVSALLLGVSLAGGAMAGDPARATERPRLAYQSTPDDDTVTQAGRPQLRYRLADTDDQLAPAPAKAPPPGDAATLAQLSQNYRPQPAIWRIGDRDTSIYMIGTIHALPPGFEWRNAGLARIIERSRLLIVESVKDDARDEALFVPNGAASKLPPLSLRVDASHRVKLAALTATLPPDAAALFDQMPSWIASVAIALVREIRSGEVLGPGADDWLEARFKAVNKPVIAIEDSGDVLTAVSAVPEADQQRMLHAALDAPVRSRADMRAATHAWAKGEMGPDSALSIDLIAATGSAAMATPLLTDRNRAWAAALAARLKMRGTILFAAGAGHFIGAGSVIEQLEARGVRVSRVQ